MASTGRTFELAGAVVETGSLDGSRTKMQTAVHCAAGMAPLPQSWQWDPDAGIDIALDKDAACIPNRRAKIVNQRNSRAGTRCRMNQVWVDAAAAATFLSVSGDHTAESLAVDGG